MVELITLGVQFLGVLVLPVVFYLFKSIANLERLMQNRPTKEWVEARYDKELRALKERMDANFFELRLSIEKSHTDIENSHRIIESKITSELGGNGTRGNIPRVMGDFYEQLKDLNECVVGTPKQRGLISIVTELEGVVNKLVNERKK